MNDHVGCCSGRVTWSFICLCFIVYKYLINIVHSTNVKTWEILYRGSVLFVRLFLVVSVSSTALVVRRFGSVFKGARCVVESGLKITLLELLLFKNYYGELLWWV